MPRGHLPRNIIVFPGPFVQIIAVTVAVLAMKNRDPILPRPYQFVFRVRSTHSRAQINEKTFCWKFLKVVIPFRDSMSANDVIFFLSQVYINKKLSWCWQTRATCLEVSQGHMSCNVISQKPINH